MKHLLEGILNQNRTALAQAISLVESERHEDQKIAHALMQEIMPYTGRAKRIGISGIPGVGKSTFIDALGTHVISQGLSVAVLAIDPSSTLSGGSILGDKTRMQKLAQLPQAYIRPSPTRGALGGITYATHEALLLCEAFGFDVVFVETVGVGQSESSVADIVDILVLLMLPGAGDDLQGIKRGLIELADIFCINKVDGDNVARAKKAFADLHVAMRILRAHEKPEMHLCSALKSEGIVELWQTIENVWATLETSGDLLKKRKTQTQHILKSSVQQLLWQKYEPEFLKLKEKNLTPYEVVEALGKRI